MRRRYVGWLACLALWACSPLEPKMGEPRIESGTSATGTAELALDAAINRVCPRSNKAIVADSLTVYRGYVVGFCNTHCRDEFAADPQASEADRRFFDALIAAGALPQR